MSTSIVRAPANRHSRSNPRLTDAKNVIKPAKLRNSPAQATAESRLSQGSTVRLLLGEALPDSTAGANRMLQLLTMGVALWNVQHLQLKGEVISPGPQSNVPDHFRGVRPYRMMVQFPKYYNPDDQGFSKPIESAKYELTLEEIEQRFPGYNRLNVEGWSRKDGSDNLVRFEIDAVFDRSARAFLTLWKAALEERFLQREIYITFHGPLGFLD
jgi:hypothetical protein